MRTPPDALPDMQPMGGTLVCLVVTHFERADQFQVQLFANGLAVQQGDQSAKSLATILRSQADAIDPPDGIVRARDLPPVPPPNGTHLPS